MQMHAKAGEKGGKDYERGKDFSDGVFGLDGGLFEEGGGRRTSRARKVVNYALPNLRDKMRREENSEDRQNGRSRSVDRSVTPDQVVYDISMVLTSDNTGEFLNKTASEGGRSEARTIDNATIASPLNANYNETAILTTYIST